MLITPKDRIFVAGHRGLAGSAICRALHHAGYTRILTATREKLDLVDSSAVERWFSKHQPTVVVLAAAKVGGIHANTSYPADFILENLKIQTNVIETAWRAGVRRLLFLGSSCIYPKFAKQPIREEALLSGPLEPTNQWYAIAKISGLLLCEALRKQHQFDAISLMPTNLYGPGDNYHPHNSHVLPSLIRRFHEAVESKTKEVKCWGSGTPLREFLYSDDLGDACVYALEHWSALTPNAPRNDQDEPLGLLNVGTGIDLSISDLADQVAKTIGYDGSINWDTSKPEGTPRKLLNVSRLGKLGWTATTPLRTGLLLAYEDFLKNK